MYDTKIDSKQMGRELVVSTAIGWGPVAGSSEHGDEHSGFLQDGDFLY
jgi:hypothetical protein